MVIHSRSVSSIFGNLEKVICERAPRSGQALLGARWSFGLPTLAARKKLSEYSFPVGPTRFVDLLADRVGLG